MTTKIEYLHADQIGGCVTLISTDTTKICIDFGENLPGSKHKVELEVSGLTYGDANYDAVFFTHYHGDHVGRFDKILPEIPLYMSRMCRYALLNIYQTLAKHDVQYQKQIDILEDTKRNHVLWSQHAVQVGDIKVTPYTIDHSAEAAMMFLIETPDKRILHMGDFRTHGFMGDNLKKLLLYYVLGIELRYKPIDILIIEGTNLTREDKAMLTEEKLFEQACSLIKKHKLVICLCSSTNFIRLHSFYKAARRAHRPVLTNSYIRQQINSYYQYKKELYEHLHPGKVGREYKPHDVYTLLLDKDACVNPLAKLQEKRMCENGAVTFVSGVSAVLTLEKLWAKYGEMQPLLLYSMWSGYIENNVAEYYNAELAEVCAKYNTVKLHTSGHASKEVVEEIIKLVNPREYTEVIHSERSERRYSKNNTH